jgi:hypothetical protein
MDGHMKVLGWIIRGAIIGVILGAVGGFDMWQSVSIILAMVVFA